jgi:hypothetical protein
MSRVVVMPGFGWPGRQLSGELSRADASGSGTLERLKFGQISDKTALFDLGQQLVSCDLATIINSIYVREKAKALCRHPDGSALAMPTKTSPLHGAARLEIYKDAST